MRHLYTFQTIEKNAGLQIERSDWLSEPYGIFSGPIRFEYWMST